MKVLEKTKDIVNNLLKEKYNIEEIKFLLDLDDPESIRYLFSKSEEVCERVYGKKIYVRGIIEFSNYCRRNCLYCGIRRDNKELKRYRMSIDEIIETAIYGYELGYKTIVLQSGEDLYYDKYIPEIIKRIKEKVDVAITLSLGERYENTYKLWKEAGADRYLMRIETTDPELFRKMHPDDNLEERKKALFTLKKLGYETGTGIIVGLPGQTTLSIAKDIIFFKKLDADMLGIGPFIPHHQTPLKNEKTGDFNLVLKTIAVSRLVLPTTNIPATTAMGTVRPNGREIAMNIGANVIMPNITPQKYRPYYKLYDNKICIFETTGQCRNCIATRVKSIGKVVVIDKGSRINLKYSQIIAK